MAAAINGAIEGFLEGLERSDLAADARESAHEAGEVARAAITEGRAQAETPEMRELRQDMRRAGETISHKSGEVADATKARVAHARDAASTRIDETTTVVREKVESAKATANRVAADVKVKAEAVGETSRRAKSAPPTIARELKQGVRAYARGMMRMLGLYAIVGVVALTTWVVLTVGLVAVLTPLVGLGFAALIVTVAYLIVAGIFAFMASKAREAGREEMREHVNNSKDEVRHVVAPVKNAFSRGRPGS